MKLVKGTKLSPSKLDKIKKRVPLSKKVLIPVSKRGKGYRINEKQTIKKK
jgi:hypothetical protein